MFVVIKVWIGSNRCTVFIPGSVLVGVHVCVCMCLRCDIRTQSAQLGEASGSSMCTSEHLGLLLSICILAVCSYTHVHIVLGCRHSWLPLEPLCILWWLNSFYFLSCLVSTLLCELRFESDWTESAIENLTESSWRRLCWPRWELNFHGDASEKYCLGLIDYENHWIQQFSWGLCYKLSKDGLSEKWTQTFVPMQPGLVPHRSLHTFMVLWGDLLKGRGREEQMEEEKRKGRCKRIRRDEGKDSWYLNHVGWLFCTAQVYLKPSSICSVPLCFQALWGNAHTQSLAHAVTCPVSPSAVFMIALHCHDAGFTLWWNHQMWTEQPAEELHTLIRKEAWPPCVCAFVRVCVLQ